MRFSLRVLTFIIQKIWNYKNYQGLILVFFIVKIQVLGYKRKGKKN